MIGYNKSEIVGKMRERVILQNRIITQSDSGFQSEIYSDIGIYWSKIEYKTGFEEEDADKLTNQQKINITLRYNILVNVNSRFVYRNELYQVEKVEYSDDRRFMTCVCVYRSSYTSIYVGSIFCSASLLAQSSLSAALMRVINFQSSLAAFGSVSADISFVQKVASSLNANALLSGDISFVQKAQASLLTSASVTGNITIPQLLNASLLATGTTTADLTVNAPSASLLLDLYPNAAAAYSLRKLRTAYTGSAIRVRRSSDNTEQDIGFVAGQLDTVSLLAFCGAGNGFVTTWYDQSGNARNAEQTTLVNQPQIVNGGIIILQNTKPTIKFNNTKLESTTFTLSSQPITKMAVVKPNVNTNSNFIDGSSLNRGLIGFGTPTTNRIFAGTVLDIGTSSVIYQLYYGLFNTVSSQIVRNGITLGIGDAGFSGLDKVILGGHPTNAVSFDGNMQEAIIYSLNQSSNRTGIETNINNYYAIY